MIIQFLLLFLLVCVICRIGGRWGQGDVYFSLYSQELGRLLFMSQGKHFLFIPKSWGVSFSCPKGSIFSLFPRVGASPLHVPREAFSLYSQELGRLLFMSQGKHFLFIPKSWGVSSSCPKRSTIFPLMVLAGWLYVPGSAQSLHGVAGGWG